MAAPKSQRLRWVKQNQAPAPFAGERTVSRAGSPTTRERLVAALADRPRTVAQLAQTFGLSQPTVLEQVRRALRDGLIAEVQVTDGEKRFPAERYYAPAVPVIRQTDQELLQGACRALPSDIASALARNRGDLQAVFAMTTLAREGWRFEDLWPYPYETMRHLALARVPGFSPSLALNPHGLAWVTEVTAHDPDPDDGAAGSLIAEEEPA